MTWKMKYEFTSDLGKGASGGPGVSFAHPVSLFLYPRALLLVYSSLEQ